MKQYRIITSDFTDADPDALSAFTSGIITSISASKFFPDVLAKVPTLQALLDELKAANLPPDDLSKNGRTKLNAIMEKVVDMLYNFSYGVLYFSENLPERLETSGFRYTNAPRKKSPAPKVPLFVSFTPTSINGEAIIRVKATPNAKNYKAAFYNVMGDEVATGSNFKSIITIRNIPTDESLQLSVCASGPGGESDWSPSVNVKLPAVSNNLLPTPEEEME